MSVCTKSRCVGLRNVQYAWMLPSDMAQRWMASMHFKVNHKSPRSSICALYSLSLIVTRVVPSKLPASHQSQLLPALNYMVFGTGRVSLCPLYISKNASLLILVKGISGVVVSVGAGLENVAENFSSEKVLPAPSMAALRLL